MTDQPNARARLLAKYTNRPEEPKAKKKKEEPLPPDRIEKTPEEPKPTRSPVTAAVAEVQDAAKAAGWTPLDPHDPRLAGLDRALIAAQEAQEASRGNEPPVREADVVVDAAAVAPTDGSRPFVVTPDGQARTLGGEPIPAESEVASGDSERATVGPPPPPDPTLDRREVELHTAVERAFAQAAAQLGSDDSHPSISAANLAIPSISPDDVHLIPPVEATAPQVAQVLAQDTSLMGNAARRSEAIKRASVAVLEEALELYAANGDRSTGLVQSEADVIFAIHRIKDLAEYGGPAGLEALRRLTTSRSSLIADKARVRYEWLLRGACKSSEVKQAVRVEDPGARRSKLVDVIFNPRSTDPIKEEAIRVLFALTSGPQFATLITLLKRNSGYTRLPEAVQECIKGAEKAIRESQLDAYFHEVVGEIRAANAPQTTESARPIRGSSIPAEVGVRTSDDEIEATDTVPPSAELDLRLGEERAIEGGLVVSRSVHITPRAEPVVPARAEVPSAHEEPGAEAATPENLRQAATEAADRNDPTRCIFHLDRILARVVGDEAREAEAALGNALLHIHDTHNRNCTQSIFASANGSDFRFSLYEAMLTRAVNQCREGNLDNLRVIVRFASMGWDNQSPNLAATAITRLEELRLTNQLESVINNLDTTVDPNLERSYSDLISHAQAALGRLQGGRALTPPAHATSVPAISVLSGDVEAVAAATPPAAPALPSRTAIPPQVSRAPPRTLPLPPTPPPRSLSPSPFAAPPALELDPFAGSVIGTDSPQVQPLQTETTANEELTLGSSKVVNFPPDFTGDISTYPQELEVISARTPLGVLSARTNYGGSGSKYDDRNEDGMFAGARQDQSVVAGVFDTAGGTYIGPKVTRVGTTVYAEQLVEKSASLTDATEAVHNALLEVEDQFGHTGRAYGCAAVVKIEKTGALEGITSGDCCVILLQNGVIAEITELGNTAFNYSKATYGDGWKHYYQNRMKGVILESIGSEEYGLGFTPFTSSVTNGTQVVVVTDGVIDMVSPYEIAQLNRSGLTGAALQNAVFDLAYGRQNGTVPYDIQLSETETIPQANVAFSPHQGDNLTVLVINVANVESAPQPASVRPISTQGVVPASPDRAPPQARQAQQTAPVQGTPAATEVPQRAEPDAQREYTVADVERILNGSPFEQSRALTGIIFSRDGTRFVEVAVRAVNELFRVSANGIESMRLLKGASGFEDLEDDVKQAVNDHTDTSATTLTRAAPAVLILANPDLSPTPGPMPAAPPVDFAQSEAPTPPAGTPIPFRTAPDRTPTDPASPQVPQPSLSLAPRPATPPLRPAVTPRTVASPRTETPRTAPAATPAPVATNGATKASDILFDTEDIDRIVRQHPPNGIEELIEIIFAGPTSRNSNIAIRAVLVIQRFTSSNDHYHDIMHDLTTRPDFSNLEISVAREIRKHTNGRGNGNRAPARSASPPHPVPAVSHSSSPPPASAPHTEETKMNLQITRAKTVDALTRLIHATDDAHKPLLFEQMLTHISNSNESTQRRSLQIVKALGLNADIRTIITLDNNLKSPTNWDPDIHEDCKKAIDKAKLRIGKEAALRKGEPFSTTRELQHSLAVGGFNILASVFAGAAIHPSVGVVGALVTGGLTIASAVSDKRKHYRKQYQLEK